MSVTVAHISKLSGCSTATVSRALNNSGSVSPKTREVVLRVMREAKAAQPRRRARRGRAPRSVETGLIDIVHFRRSPFEQIDVHDGSLEVGPLNEQLSEDQLVDRRFRLSHSFHRQIVDGAVSEAMIWGQRSTIQIVHDLEDENLLNDLSRADRAGVLLLGEPPEGLAAFVDRCPHPLVIVDMSFDGWPDVITTDNVPGIAQAFDHLYSLGHRRIGYIGRCDSNFAYAERYTAFRLKMIDANLPVREDWVFTGFTHIEPATEGVKKILSKEDRPTALICGNDCVALAAIRAAAQCNIKVPQELSIVGFDDIEAGALITPPLTTIHVPVVDMGRQAVRQLMLQIQAGSSVHRRGTHIRLSPSLVVRSSTAAVPVPALVTV